MVMKPHWPILCDTFLFTILALNIHKTCSIKIEIKLYSKVIKLKCVKEKQKKKSLTFQRTSWLTWTACWKFTVLHNRFSLLTMQTPFALVITCNTLGIMQMTVWENLTLVPPLHCTRGHESKEVGDPPSHLMSKLGLISIFAWS